MKSRTEKRYTVGQDRTPSGYWWVVDAKGANNPPTRWKDKAEAEKACEEMNSGRGYWIEGHVATADPSMTPPGERLSEEEVEHLTFPECAREMRRARRAEHAATNEWNCWRAETLALRAQLAEAKAELEFAEQRERDTWQERDALADLAYQASATGDRDPGLLEAIDEARALLASKTKGGGK